MSASLPPILVTGATGFLGRHVLRRLLESPDVGRVVLATRGSVSPRNDDTEQLEYAEMDLMQAVALPGGIHTVLHIAGEKRDESRMDAVNHQGTRRLVEAAAHAGVRRFVYVSSVGSYGARLHSGLVNEAFPHTPLNRYEASKDAGEKCVREICAGAGMESVVLQPSNVIGLMPGQVRPLLGLMKMVSSGYFTWFGRAEPWVNYVAVEDVAAAVVAATMHASARHDYIINTPAKLSHLVGWIAEELAVPVPGRRLPLWVGEVAAAFGAMASRVLGRDLSVNRDRFRELTNTTQYDASLLMKDLSFEYPIGVEALIRGLVRSYRQDGLL